MYFKEFMDHLEGVDVFIYGEDNVEHINSKDHASYDPAEFYKKFESLLSKQEMKND